MACSGTRLELCEKEEGRRVGRKAKGLSQAHQGHQASRLQAVDFNGVHQMSDPTFVFEMGV